MGVMTSKMNALARRGLGVFDLARFFDVVVGSDDVTIHKPDPDPLLVAASALGVPIERCGVRGGADGGDQGAAGSRRPFGMISAMAGAMYYGNRLFRLARISAYAEGAV